MKRLKHQVSLMEPPFVFCAPIRFDEPPPWRVRFDPDLGASNFYVVELPAAQLIEQLRDATGAEIGIPVPAPRTIQHDSGGQRGIGGTKQTRAAAPALYCC